MSFLCVPKLPEVQLPAKATNSRLLYGMSHMRAVDLSFFLGVKVKRFRGSLWEIPKIIKFDLRLSMGSGKFDVEMSKRDQHFR